MPRIYAELGEAGVPVGRDRIARLMRHNLRRRHSSLGYPSPNEFEGRHAEGKTEGLCTPGGPFTLES